MSNATVKRKGIIAQQDPDLEEGYNARFISFMQEIIPSEPLDYSDVPEMERRFNHYLQKCAEHDFKVSNQGAYIAIGIDKGTAWDWINRSTNKERSDFVKKVQRICGWYREGLMAENKLNPVVGIFWQKNYDGFKDQQEVVVTPNNPLGDEQNPDELKQKYLDDTYGEQKQIEQNRTMKDVIEDVKLAEGAETAVKDA